MPEAYLKALLASGYTFARPGNVGKPLRLLLSLAPSFREETQREMTTLLPRLQAELYATQGTKEWLADMGLVAQGLFKVQAGHWERRCHGARDGSVVAISTWTVYRSIIARSR